MLALLSLAVAIVAVSQFMLLRSVRSIERALSVRLVPLFRVRGGDPVSVDLKRGPKAGSEFPSSLLPPRDAPGCGR
jgi:hypothetical protein